MDILISLLQTPVFGATIGLWSVFLVVVLGLVIFDLGILNKDNKAISFKHSVKLTLFYILCSVLFGVWIWFQFGSERSFPYFTAYLVEKSLSLDNVFVMSIIFSYYNIPLAYQHRVLFWGILGVLVLRGIVISLGTVLTAQFGWLLFLFGGLLIYTGVRIFMSDEDDEMDVENSQITKVLTANFNVTNELQGNKFVIWKPLEKKFLKKIHLTPLFMALITIEFADVLFAMDSIPAVLSISTDTFVILTSNVFAILGLRAMYFMLASLLERFEYLRYALSVVLIFIGAKVFYSHMFGEISPLTSLLITLTVLIVGAVVSFMKTKAPKGKTTPNTSEKNIK